ncbi:MAG TPA: YihY/virulence factor BrkB family protein [Steroidobacteraceae bacterium]
MADSTESGRHAHGGLWPLVQCAFRHWSVHQASTIGAALAFYCAFSLAPLLIILVKLLGWFVGTEMAYGQLAAQLTTLFGPATATILLKAMQSSQTGGGTLATVVSAITLLAGATTVFTALESALEHIWDARALVPKGVWGWLRARLLSFGLILAVGFLLLVSLTISTALSALRKVVAQRLGDFVLLATALDFVISIGLVTALIALIYRYLPARRLAWSPILWGALVTALLFDLGRWAIGLYLGKSTQPSAFGAAASFAALLLWLYYSAQIFLLGAEFTACLGRERPAHQPRSREDHSRAQHAGGRRPRSRRAAMGA